MKKTILASALAFAFVGTASAAQWVDIPEDVNTEKLMINTGYKTDASYSEDYSVISAEKNGSGQIGFAKTNSVEGAEFTKDARLWVGGGTGFNVIGLLASGEGQTFVNNGSIYAYAEDASDWWRVKGMFANAGGVAENNGLIYAKNAIAMSLGTSGSSQLVNGKDGVIVVEGKGAAFDVSAKDTAGEVVNEGTIIVNGGDEAFGIRATDGIAGAEITNAGTIIASEGANAISVIENPNGTSGTAKATTVNLVKGSHIEGLVVLNETSTLNIAGVQGETIELETHRDKGAAETDKLTVSATDGSNVTIRGTDSALDIGTMTVDEKSSTNFELTHVADKVLSVQKLEGNGEVNVGYTAEVSDQLQAGDVEAQALIDGVTIDGKKVESVTVAQGVNGDEVLVNADGSVQVLRTNDLITSTQDLAVATALMWRSQLSSLSDRMGTLRTMPETAGAWARYNNGRLDGDDTTHDYNTVELGFDKAINDNVTLGVSFDYTKGDTDVFAGNADSNTYTFGLYGSYFNDSGCYLDTMLKVGRVDADYDLRTSAGAESADYMMSGVVLGIETGHRWDIQNFFVEPQIQLTYSYLRPDDFTTSLNRNIKFEDMDSLIARVGVMAGMKFAEERGAAYVKASYNHDFLGDVEGFYSYEGSTRHFKDEMDDNWGEVSLGATYNVTDSVHTFLDVGTGFGGDIDQKWRVNLGARYVF